MVTSTSDVQIVEMDNRVLFSMEKQNKKTKKKQQNWYRILSICSVSLFEWWLIVFLTTDTDTSVEQREHEKKVFPLICNLLQLNGWRSTKGRIGSVCLHVSLHTHTHTGSDIVPGSIEHN